MEKAHADINQSASADKRMATSKIESAVMQNVVNGKLLKHETAATVHEFNVPNNSKHFVVLCGTRGAVRTWGGMVASYNDAVTVLQFAKGSDIASVAGDGSKLKVTYDGTLSLTCTLIDVPLVGDYMS